VHLAGEGRLGNMELPGGTGNGALFYNDFKVSELPEVHLYLLHMVFDEINIFHMPSYLL
jgi:hypothetical protein